MAAWLRPVNGGKITQWWGNPNSGYKAGYHTGIDISAPSGTTVFSVAQGKVVEAGWNSAYGNYVKVFHPDSGLYTFYAHLSSLNVSAGQSVGAGATLGGVGSTGNSSGPHLHFEIRNGAGGYYDNVNPAASGYIDWAGLPSTAGPPNQSTTTNSATSTTGATTVADQPLTAADFGFASAFLAANPELNAIVNQAIAEKWTNARLQGRIIDSAWYRARTDAQRKYDQELTSDPATVAEKERVMLEELKRLATIMGVSPNGLEAQAKESVRNGLSANDAIGFLATRASYSEEQINRAGLVQQALLNYSDDYGITLSMDEMGRTIRDVLSTGPDWAEVLSGQEDRYRERAKKMYVAVADQIDKGATVKDLLDPYMSRAAENLGINKAMMSTASSMWNRPISGPQVMNLQEWDKVVRNDSAYRWDNGPQALDWARSVGDDLLRAMGAKS